MNKNEQKKVVRISLQKLRNAFHGAETNFLIEIWGAQSFP